jgi:hypothetical protein
VPLLAHCPNFAVKGQPFDEIAGLFTAANGDVFVLTRLQKMLRFGEDGHFIADYDLRAGEGPNQFFSAIATPDGGVYSISKPVRDEAQKVVGLQLNHWPKPGPYTSRIIDRRGYFVRGQVFSDEILLMGADGENNLYFEYRYKLDTKQVSPATWMGPMAIAKVGADNKIKKIFDIYQHYKDEMERAKQQSDAKRQQRGPIGIGDLIHVSANGDLYLEVADATHYRIDKIFFAQK